LLRKALGGKSTSKGRNLMAPIPSDRSKSDHAVVVKRWIIEHYDELHDIAARQFARESADHTLEATALVNEAVLRLLDSETQKPFKDSKHFLATANQIMKHILTDRARHKRSGKAGGQMHRCPLPDSVADPSDPIVNDLILEEELRRLAAEEPLAARIVELRCQGHSIEEAAVLADISRSNAYDLWRFGRAWLLKALEQPSSTNSHSDPGA